jgi:hypothetical protein
MILFVLLSNTSVIPVTGEKYIFDKINRANGIEEFNYFKHFDRKENLIHIFSEQIFGDWLPEDPATVKEGQLVRWGYEWFSSSEEPNETKEKILRDFIEEISATTVFMIDGVEVNGWNYSDVYFFESWDHDGDGPGDGDGDGIGDVGPGYLSAFRYSTILTVGEHIWYYEAIIPDTNKLISDSGIVYVELEE